MEPFPFAIWPVYFEKARRSSRSYQQQQRARSLQARKPNTMQSPLVVPPPPRSTIPEIPSLDIPVPSSEAGKSSAKMQNAYSAATLKDLQKEGSQIYSRMKSLGTGGATKGARNWRIQHSANVGQIAGRIAMLNPELGLDPKEAWKAGLTHDIAKGLSPKSTNKRPGDSMAMPKWMPGGGEALHAVHGAKVASDDGYPDEWSKAILHHSTGGHNMSPEEKVIYLADLIGPERRDHEHLTAVRRMAMNNPDAALNLHFHHRWDALLGGNGVRKNPRNDSEILSAYKFYDRDGQVIKQAPSVSHAAMLSGLMPKGRIEGRFWRQKKIENPFDEGFSVRIDPTHQDVRRIVGSAFKQIDEAKKTDEKSRILKSWLEGNSRQSEKFRGYLPAFFPVMHDKYGDLFAHAQKTSKKSRALIDEIAASAYRMNAGSSEYYDHISKHFNPDWFVGKKKAAMFADPRNEKFSRFKIKQEKRFKGPAWDVYKSRFWPHGKEWEPEISNADEFGHDWESDDDDHEYGDSVWFTYPNRKDHYK